MSEQPQPEAPQTRAQIWRRRARRFFLRHLPISVAGLVVFVALCAVGLYFYASSASFENDVRKHLIASLEDLTGGRVEIASFHWHLLGLEADAGGIVIHGREAANEKPYARIDNLHVRVSILGLLSPHIRLSELDVTRPQLHLIVYPNGSTNQPEPRKPHKPGKPMIEQLFNLKAGRFAVTEGLLDYDNRADSFDFQDRYIPLDFRADHVALRMSYVPASTGKEESYHIEAGATDLDLARGNARHSDPKVHGRLQATLDLMRNGVALRRLLVSARGADGKQRAAEITGSLTDFKHPRWQARAGGELDMHLIEPLTGFQRAPEGIARLALVATGSGKDFKLDGHVYVDGGAYVGNGVTARNFDMEAQVHADPARLLITQIVVKFRRGGRIDGIVDLAHWFAPTTPLLADDTLPVDGKVTAAFQNLPLDTLLAMVDGPSFQRLGIGAVLNGPASATWTKGDTNTLVVNTTLRLGAVNFAGEAPANGLVDAAYTERDGSVNLRALKLYTPASQLQASGRIGAYPMTSPTSLAIDFHSHNLGEFDTLLRDLGLNRGARSGAAALPIKLGGEGDFHGEWTGSLDRPNIAGNLRAARLSLEMPEEDSAKGQTRFVDFDEVEANGSYSEQRIAIDHALLKRGAEQLQVSGSLDAARIAEPVEIKKTRGAGEVLAFDRDSLLHLRVHAANVNVSDLQPFVKTKLPLTGVLTAQFEANGPLHSPDGSGWVELANGSFYGEPVTHAKAQGSLTKQTLHLTSFSAGMAGGSITGTGTYDIAAHRFQANAQASGVELARVGWVARHATVNGKLKAAVTGSGTFDDPHLEGHATLSSLTAGGEKLGDLKLTAHTEGRVLHYDAITQLAGAKLNLVGQTELRGDYATSNRVDFTKFDIGALLRMAHVSQVSGESALEGTVSVDGPLAHPDQLRGDARIKQFEATLAGVRLASEGGAHATLAGGRIHFDPVHVTGEDTDLRAQATFSFTGSRQIDAAASGSINLRLAETLDPDLTASGTTTFEVEAHGTVQNPGLRGRIDINNSSLSLEDLPNGLSQIKGTLVFNQNRLEVRQLTAMSGGGLLSVGGSLTYQHGLYADLSVTGKGVRIRYPQGVSSLADANLRLQGPQSNLLLSGNVLITRFATSPNLDLASLAAQTGAKVEAVAPPNSPSNHVRLDVHLSSSPQLNFQNAFAKLAGDVDLHVRGTLASPSVLGRVSITEGSAMLAGTRYDLQRGEITLANPVRIEPVIDLTASARVEDYDIVLGLHGTLQKMQISYRSDPPLPEADVVSLLAMGRTENQERLYTQQQKQELAPASTDALLGGALNATVSSRMQKLFGAGSVKVDPNYLGAFGNSTSRVTVQEQLGRVVTLTYATDVNTTGQQLLQAEVAINRHVSLVVARDESGVFSMVIKATRRYR